MITEQQLKLRISRVIKSLDTIDGRTEYKRIASILEGLLYAAGYWMVDSQFDYKDIKVQKDFTIFRFSEYIRKETYLEFMVRNAKEYIGDFE